MIHGNMTNERVKRRYFVWLREAKGLSEATLTSIERSLLQFEEFTKFEDFKHFGRKAAVDYKNWLTARGASLQNRHHTLRQLMTFLQWLATQPGYKSAISLNDIEYLSLDRKQRMTLLATKPVNFPSLAYVRSLTQSIGPCTEIDVRDRALIAFLLLSGIRDMAAASLPLGCLDIGNLTVTQDPSLGVQTKFGKNIVSYLFPFDDELLQYVQDHVKHLTETKLFSPCDPLFPRTRLIFNQETHEYEVDGLEPKYWNSTGPVRSILKKRSEAAGLPYYHPHTFRHAASHLATARSLTPNQFIAISQNLGHGDVATTLRSYSKLDPEALKSLIVSLPSTESSTRMSVAEAIRVLEEELIKKQK